MTTSLKGGSVMSALTGEIAKKAYDKETFVSLIECCSRLFFRDEEIVIIDLLLVTEHAISEKDIEIEIGLPEQSVREHLTRLERHGILTRLSNAQSANIYQKPPRAPRKEITKETTPSNQIYWRINNHVILVIHYKLSKMEETLQQRRKSLYECDRFLCPECNSTYDALEVQKLDMDGFDSHFICYCGTKVELDDKSSKDDLYASQQKRCEDQVKTLKKCLYEAWGMEVPEFPIFTRKSALKQLVNKSGATIAAEESSIVGETNSATGAPSSVVSDSSATNVKDTSNSVILSDTGNQSSVSDLQGGKKIRFHMRVAPGVKNLVKLSSEPAKPITPSRESVTPGIVQEVVSSGRESGKSALISSIAFVVKDEIPNFYISKLDKTLTLIEAQEYQQHMTNAEFEVRLMRWGIHPFLGFPRVTGQILECYLVAVVAVVAATLIMYDIFKICATDGRSRTGILSLSHGEVKTPIFMPVGTKAAIKGMDYPKLESSECVLSLANTYHLACRPGKEILSEAKGIHNFTESHKNFLTDSGNCENGRHIPLLGGFQMVSLCSLSQVTEEGVLFRDPYDSNLEILLTPEESISTQNAIGADIIMALDDVVSATVRDKERLTLATHRTTRWLDRCIKAHTNPEKQHLFAIVQGSIYPDLRKESLKSLKARKLPGYAIGGLSGGEDKNDFWRVVELCTREGVGLPKEKPRYLMGVGYIIDIIISVSLGCDMFDCVFPTRTARYGTALTDYGPIRLQHAAYQYDFRPIDKGCDCLCCEKYSRSFLHYGFRKGILVTRLLTIHNIRYMMCLCQRMQRAISEGSFGIFVRGIIRKMYIEQGEFPPLWVRDALFSTGINIFDFYTDNIAPQGCFD